MFFFMKPLKENYPNLYIIIIAVTISVWFEGINQILHHFISSSLQNGIMLCILALSIFYFDDGSLSELYNLKPEKKKNLTNYAGAYARRRRDN